MSETATLRRSAAAVLAAAALVYAIFIARTAFLVDGVWHFTLFDDAMISMRYARNFADGHGLVWNVGEAPVEGYTNLLWALWMAAVHATGISTAKTSLVIAISGVPLLIGTAWVAADTVRLVSDERAWAPTVTLVLVAFSYPLMYWTLRGNEVGAIAFALTLGCRAALRLIDRVNAADAVTFGAAAVAAILLRLDSAVPVFILSAAAVVWAREARVRLALAFGAAIAVAVGVHLGFSGWYYHSLLPNTYYLKMTGVSLATRVARGSLFAVFVAIRHLYPALILAVCAWSGSGSPRLARLRWICAGVFAGQVAYSVYVGGDAWESFGFSNRYIAVALPLLMGMAAIGVDRFARHPAGSLASLRLVLTALAAATALKVVLEWSFFVFDRNVDYELLTIYEAHHRSGVLAFSLALAGLGLLACVSGPLGRALGALPEGRGLLGGRHATVALTFAAAVWILMNGQPALRWVFFNAEEALYDNRMARAGLLINASTDTSAVIAAARVGVFSYFADRRSVDLLGKADPVVARMRPVGTFKPGHDRWNYPESITRGGADVIGDLWLPSPGDFRFLSSSGFVEMPNRLYVRTGSPHVNLSRIGKDVDRS